MKAQDISKARGLVNDTRAALTKAFYPDKTPDDQKSVFDELWPAEDVQDHHVRAAMRVIPELHAFLQTAWTKSGGKKEDPILRAAKASAENMRNVVSLAKVVKSTFLDNLDDIDACLDTIEALKKRTK